MKNHFLALFLISSLLAHTPTISAQSKLLASVEIVEASASAAPPAEKKKLKKKRHKKHFKKPNKTKNKKIDFIKLGILFNLIGTSHLSFFALVTALILLGSSTLLGALWFIFFMAVSLVCLMNALIFLKIYVVYITREKKASNKNLVLKKSVVKKKIVKKTVLKKTVLKKSEEVLRAEVPYLNTEKTNLYLSLNEELTAAKVRKNSLIHSKGEINEQEWATVNKEIKALKAQIRDLRRQNKTMEVRSTRS